jgi:hypothetical protein
MRLEVFKLFFIEVRLICIISVIILIDKTHYVPAKLAKYSLSVVEMNYCRLYVCFIPVIYAY